MKPFATLTALVTAGTLVTAAPAAVVVQTGFETTDDPAFNTGNLTTSTASPVFRVGGDASRAQIVNTPDVFGPGNQYLQLSGNNMNVRAPGVTPLTTVAFDMFQPSTSAAPIRFGYGVNDVNVAQGYIQWSINNGQIGTGSNTQLASGSAPALMTDRHYVAYTLLNRSGATETVDWIGGSMTLNDGQAGLVFFDTVDGQFIDGGVYNHTAGNTPQNFLFRAFSGDEGGQLFVDNFTRRNDLFVVPEPSTALLGGLGLFALLLRRRRG